MRFRYIIVSLAALLTAGSSAFAQPADYIINLDTVQTYNTMTGLRAGFISISTVIGKEYSPGLIAEEPMPSVRISPKEVSKKIITEFTLYHTGDTAAKFYFFPGTFFSDTRLYKIENGRVDPLPSIAPDHKDSVSFRLIAVPPHDTVKLMAEIIQVKTYNNIFRPRIINSLYLSSLMADLPAIKKSEAVFTYFFCGLLMMMVLFSLANYFQGSNREFLYYAGYALFLGFMLFTKPYYYGRSNEKNFFYESYLDFILQGIGICFYMTFMMRFLATRKNYPFLYKLYVTGIISLIVSMLIYTWLHFGTENYYFQNFLENYITKGLLLIMVVIFLFYAGRRREERLLRYLFWGNLFYFIFAMISLLIILVPDTLKLSQFWRSSLVYYEFGLLIELIFFLMGLTYKNRKQIIEQTRERERLKLENERKEMEKQMAVMAAHQEERNRISADIHDELGSGMTTIRLMSEIAKNKMKEAIPVEIEKISNSADDVLNKINAIIWSMNSRNDTVDNLVSYIRAYSLEYMEGTSIQCRVNTPDFVPREELSGDKRRNIFLCVKETLNNTLKHSKASSLVIDIQTGDKLIIRIADNGSGIDMQKLREFGNGLKNISRRMKSIGGSFSIENKNGTVTTLQLPV